MALVSTVGVICGVGLVVLLPALRDTAGRRPPPAPFLAALVILLLAALAAVAIGALRPLGRRSEWLLLPFAPWLFVGAGPLGIAWFSAERSLHLRWHALVGAGMPSGWAFLRAVVLPMAGLLTGVAMLIQAQGLVWPLLGPRPPSTRRSPC